MLSNINNTNNQAKLWKKAVSLTFVVAILATSFPTESASAKAAQSEAVKSSAQNAADVPAAKSGAQVIGAVVPFLPMESSGIAFARIFALNIGSSPTAQGSTVKVSITGLPNGVTISEALPAPGANTYGWKCVTDACSWVNAQGNGVQIQPGQTVEGIIKFSIAPEAQIAPITDSEIQVMIDAAKSVTSADDPDKQRVDAIAQRLTTLKVGVSVQGDTAATSQETSSYLAVTKATGRARVAAVLSGSSAVSVGEEARWTARLLNIGSADGPATVKVKNFLPSSLSLQDVSVSGKNWDCGDASSSVESCVYNGSLAAGGVSEPLNIQSTVSEKAKTGIEQKWKFSVEDMPVFLPNDASFTAIEAVAPDLGLQMIVGNQVIVPGGSIELHLQAGTYGGSTHQQVVLDITGVPGATLGSITKANGTNSSGFVSLDADGKPIEGEVVKNCDATETGLLCQVRPLKKGELYGAVLSLRFPSNFTSKENSVVVKAALLTEDEEQDKTSNNSVGVPVVVQPANAPYPALLPAKMDEKGNWNAFSGESVQLKSGKPAEFGYVIKNTGAKPFPVGAKLALNLMLQDGVTSQVKSDWTCVKQNFPAPQFTQDQRLGAAIAARTAGIGFDLDRPASQLEAQLLEQIKEQATITPIPNLSGEVPGLACSLTLKKQIAVGEISPAAVFGAEVSEDAEMSVSLWRAELTLPALEQTPKVDLSAITTSSKKSIAPMVVANPVRAGSVSSVEVSIVNKGELATEHPAIVLSIPAGLRLNKNVQLPKGWKCVFLAQGLANGLGVCTSNKLAGAEQSAVAQFQLEADTRRNTASVIHSVALTNSAKIGLAAASESTVEVKEPLNVKVVGPETINDISVPLGGGEPAATRVSMSAQSSSDGVVFTWKQLCLTPNEKSCGSVSPRVTWVKQEGQSGEFLAPKVEAPVELIIQATAHDNGATATDTYSVRLIPRPKVQAPPQVFKPVQEKSNVQKSSVRKSSVRKLSKHKITVRKSSIQRSTQRVVHRVKPRSTATTVPVAEEANGAITSDNEVVNAGNSAISIVQGYVPSSLSATASAGDKGDISRIYSLRQFAELSVRANVLGGSVIAGERGKQIHSLAGLAGAQNASWSWSFINGPDDLKNNADFQTAISESSTPSLIVAIPAAPEGQSSQQEIVTLKVSATVNGQTVSDVLTIQLVDDAAKGIASTEQAIALDGVNRDRPVVLGVGASTTIGAAVEEGNTVVWSVNGESASISSGSATGVKITALTIGTSWVNVEVRDADGNSIDSVTFPVAVTAVAAFSNFCEQLTSGVKQATSSLAGFNIDSELGAAPDCDFEQTIEFTDKSLTLGAANLSGLSGSLNREGIFIQAGTVESQLDLPVGKLVVKNVYIPFQQGNRIGSISGVLTGSLSDSVLKTLQIDSWDVGAEVRIAGSELKHVVVKGTKSQNSDSVLTAAGTFGPDGSVLLEASATNLELFGALTVNAQGSITFPASGNAEFSLSAGLAKAVVLTDGIELSEASLAFDSSNRVTGSGKVSINRNGLNFDVETSIDLTDEKQEFTFASTVPSLEPVSGFSLTNVAVSGKIAHIAEGFAGDLVAAAENISLSGGFVVVTKPSITFGLDCTDGAYEKQKKKTEEDATSDTGVATTTVAEEAPTTTTVAPDEESDATTIAPEVSKDAQGCDVAFGVTAGIEVGLENPATGALVGSFDSAKETLSFEGSLKNVNFGSGVVLKEFSLELKYEEGEASFTGQGDLEVLGVNVTASVLASKSNMVLRAGLTDLKPFGTDEISLKSGEVIIVANYEEGKKYTWTPADDELAKLVGSQELTTGDVKIAAIVGMPKALENVKSLTKERFSLPTKAMLRGEYSFTSGKSLYSVETDDGSLTLSGSFSREAKGEPWAYDLKLNVPEAITIIDGLQLKSFALRVTNLDDKGNVEKLSVTGEGEVDLSFSGISASVKANVEFVSREKWSLSVSGTASNFSAIPGLELNDLDFGGSLTRNGKNFSGDLNVSASDVTFANGMVKLVNPTLTAKVECGKAPAEEDATSGGNTTVPNAPSVTTTTVAETAADDAVDADAKDCGFVIDSSMDIEVNANGQTYTGKMAGSIDGEKKTASFSAELGDISFSDDVKLTGVSARFDATDNDFNFVINGAVDLFGSKLSGRVTVGTDTAVLQVGVKGLSPFGDSGPSIRAGEVVLVLQSPEAGWAWTPIEDDLQSLVSDVIVANKDIRIAAIVGMPSSIDQVERLTQGVVALPSTINITGRFNFGSGAIDLTASATSNTFTVSGSLSRAGTDTDWVWDVSLQTTRSINLIPGFDRLALSNLSFNITNKNASGEVGPVTINLDGALRLTISNSSVLTVGATVRFAGTDDWNLTVTGAIAGEDGGSWEVIPGLRLPAAKMTGTVSKISGEFQASLRIEQTSDWRPISAITIKDMFIEVGVKREPASGWDFSFLLGGKLKVAIGSLVLPELAITGGYENGIWFLQVAVGDETCRNVPIAQSSSDSASPTTTSAATSTSVAAPTSVTPSPTEARTERVCERVISITSGLEIIDATFRLQYDTNSSELSVAINGGLRILGFQIDASVKLSNKGLFLVAGVKNWELFAGGPKFAEMAVIFSTFDTNYTLASGFRTSIPGMDVTLVAQMAMPEGIKKTVGDVQLEPLKISMRGLLTGNIDIRIGIVLPPEAWIFKAGGYGLRLASVGLQLSIRNFADVTVGIYGEARLLVPNQTDQVPGRIAISFSSTGTLSINMSIGLDADGNSVPWQNVFGIDGLTINFAAFSFGINFSSTPIPTPEIGMAVSFQLPRALRNLVGMEDGINMEGAFFFSTTRGVCLVISVGQEPRVGDTARTLPKAIDVFNHNLIGNYLGIKFAPIGCKIAEKTYEPGISVGFSAAIMGVSFTALAKIDIKKLELQIYANFDAFTIGGLKMKQTYLDLLISGTSPLDSHVIFSGGFDLNLPAGTTTVSLQVVAKLGSEPVFAIDGRVDQMIIVPGILEIRKVRVQGLVKPTELKLFVNLEGEVLILGSKATGAFRLDVDSSGVREVSAKLNADIKLAGDAIGVNGIFDFTYLKGGFPKLAFAGTLSAAGRQLASAEGSLDQYAFSMKAQLDLGSVFKGQVEGKIVLCNPDGAIKVQNQAGQMVTGATGDFYFNASASIDLGLAAASGTVRFGRTPSEDRIVAQNCPVMAPTVSSANADQVMSDAMGSALRCAPGLQPVATPAPSTSAGQVTTSTTPCPTTSSTTVRATSTTAPVTSTTVRVTTTTTTVPVTTSTTIRAASTTTTTVPVTTTTSVQVPLAPRSTWSEIKLNANLNLGPLQGAIRFAGSFDSAGNVNMTVNGQLTVAPLANVALSGSFTRSAAQGYTALLTFDGTVSNIASVRFSGHIKNGEYDFAGTGNLNLGSVVRSDGVFRLSNIPGREGLKADVNFFAGNDAMASVRGSGVMVFSGSWWDAEFGATFRTPIGNIGAGVFIGNMRVQRREVRLTGWRGIFPVYSEIAVPCREDGYPGGTVVVAGQTFCALEGNRLDVRAGITIYNQNFGIGATITSNSFVATAAAPWWYNDGAAQRGEEWSLNYLGSYNVFWFPFRTVSLQVWWGGRLTIQAGVPNQPSISFQGVGKLRFNWYFSVTCNATLRGAFNPTYLGAGVNCGLGGLWVSFG